MAFSFLCIYGIQNALSDITVFALLLVGFQFRLYDSIEKKRSKFIFSLKWRTEFECISPIEFFGR